MALTQKEKSARLYRRRKDNGLCPKCGKVLDREGHYCTECLVKERIYVSGNRSFYRENHLCTECGKVTVPESEKICPECRAKYNNRRKPLSKEQKERYKKTFCKQQKSLYWQRKEQGLCTKCGKRKPMSGRAKCGICLDKDAQVHRKIYYSRPNIREYRKENHLCYYCGNEIDLEKGQLCSACLEKCRQNGIKGGGNNDYWKRDNEIVFMKKR